MKILEGQKALVTGGDSGIGAALVSAYAKAGAAVGIFYHHDSDDRAQALAAEVRAEGGEALLLKGDVSKEDDVRSQFKSFIDRFGRIDILASNAGLQKDAAAAAMTLDDWRTVIDVNLTGAFLCAREAINCFMAQGPAPHSRATGKIIFMSSVHERIPWGGHINYAASKGGMKLLMESLAQEVAAKKIRVNSIAPGAIKTHINEAAWSDPEHLKRLLTLIPYGRIGEPEDVAKAAVWLASDEADYVTGTTLFIDGGMTLYPGFGDNG